jgi:hypothetical protein
MHDVCDCATDCLFFQVAADREDVNLRHLVSHYCLSPNGCRECARRAVRERYGLALDADVGPHGLTVRL